MNAGQVKVSSKKGIYSSSRIYPWLWAIPFKGTERSHLLNKTHFTYKECQKDERVEKESKGLKRNNSKEK